jgi:hypothetical protein
MAPFWCQIWHTREHSRFASAGPISLTSILIDPLRLEFDYVQRLADVWTA